MKQLVILSVVILCAFASGAQPYKATYSSNFKMGNQKYANMILDMWKDWDDNALERHDYVSDTVTAYFPDGTMVKGKAAFLESGKKYRSGFTTVKSVVHAWLPLYSEDRKTDILCIWGEEADTAPDGKTTTTNLHEVWFFNKDGKITALRQFMAKPAMQN
jgi:ketosteroid isomerase-like protein